MDIWRHSATADLTVTSTDVTTGKVTTSHYSGVRRAGFTKPDKSTHSKKVDGYRPPTNYRTTHKPQSSYLQYPLQVEVTGDGYTGSGLNRKFVRVTGTEALSTDYVGAPAGPNVNELRTRVLLDIKNEVFDVAMVLAEMQGTVDLLGTNLVRLGKAMDTMRKRSPEHAFYLMFGKRPDGRRPTDAFLRDTASAYLEWKYGVMPTVFDIQGACKALDMNEEGSFWENAPLLVARSRITTTHAQTRDMQGVDGRIRDRRIPVMWYRERQARCDYRVKGEALRGLNRYGLGLSTVATVAFERTPFSFVANMAIPMADIVKAWSALSGVEVAGYCETDYYRMDIPAGSSNLAYQPGVNISLKWRKQEGTVEYFTRTAYRKPPMPMPYVRNPIKTGNLATALALFTQLRNPTGYTT